MREPGWISHERKEDMPRRERHQIQTCARGNDSPRGFVSVIGLCTAFCALGIPVQEQQAQAFHLQPANAVFDSPGQEYTRITGIRELRDGHLLIADRVENRLELLDWNTGTATSVGREGDGPGEYRAVAWMYSLGGDSTLVTDPLRRHWYVMDGPRIVDRIIGGGKLGYMLDPWLFGADGSGNILGTMRPMGGQGLFPPREAADSLYLVLARIGSERLDTVATVKGQASQATVAPRYAPGGSILSFPFRTEELGLLFGDGWIAVARLDPYRVDWRKPNGEWVRGPPLPFTPQRIDNREKCLAIRMIDLTTGPCDPDAVEAPDVLPPFLPMASRAMVGWQTSTLFATPDGKLLIRRTPSATSPGNRYDLVDRRGQLDGTLTLPENEAVIGFGATSVYILVMDEWGLETLRRHPWP